jgi:hypothetical protein
VWKTISAINSCDELLINFLQTMEECLIAAEGFASISDQNCTGNCVSVLDSYANGKHIHDFFQTCHQKIG